MRNQGRGLRFDSYWNLDWVYRQAFTNQACAHLTTNSRNQLKSLNKTFDLWKYRNWKRTEKNLYKGSFHTQMGRRNNTCRNQSGRRPWMIIQKIYVSWRRRRNGSSEITCNLSAWFENVFFSWRKMPNHLSWIFERTSRSLGRGHCLNPTNDACSRQ